MQEATQHGDQTGSYLVDSGNLNNHRCGKDGVNHDTLCAALRMNEKALYLLIWEDICDIHLTEKALSNVHRITVQFYFKK